MDLTKIVSISGKPGLFQVTGQGKNSVVVESLLDGKRFPAFAQDRMSSLEEISIFTTTEDMLLKEVFKNIHEKLGDKLDFEAKKLSVDALKEKFALVVPDFDEEAVYPSDMKKVFNWYQLLIEKQLLDFTEETEEPSEKADQENPEEKTEA
ncbi:MAG: DUF5606 domain-containing protein [Bacteroidetes bacterium]|nr:DUF5606 domain-containing protein [Bacteroidota bacterium]MBU1580413.1 DUF5606 domain-containing protein [Bacteroidota bacterium]MBU2465309.1 DUF5606 domain-containing protein [Bacteroidota bacterium]MBU2556172.1 DUF5606 domain-containing protein [Bacteroidota bacterium]